MDLTILRRLNEINRTFYDAHAENFADTRPQLNPGVKQILATLPPGARVLELGCGDGKVARWLAAQAAPAFYVGLDSSAGMLARARRYTDALAARLYPPLTPAPLPLTFAPADLTASDWTDLLPAEPFDWVLAFAVLHHLPGAATRARLFSQMAAHLKPGGLCAISNWQFTRSARLRRHILPWSELGLAEAEVEANDYLLSWERGEQRGRRYVHLLGEAEARQLAEAAGLTVTQVFNADGHTGTLAEYVVMQKPIRAPTP